MQIDIFTKCDEYAAVVLALILLIICLRENFEMNQQSLHSSYKVNIHLNTLWLWIHTNKQHHFDSDTDFE